MKGVWEWEREMIGLRVSSGSRCLTDNKGLSVTFHPPVPTHGHSLRQKREADLRAEENRWRCGLGHPPPQENTDRAEGGRGAPQALSQEPAARTLTWALRGGGPASWVHSWRTTTQSNHQRTAQSSSEFPRLTFGA